MTWSIVALPLHDGDEPDVVAFEPTGDAPLGDRFEVRVKAVSLVLERADDDPRWAYSRVELRDPDGKVAGFIPARTP